MPTSRSQFQLHQLHLLAITCDIKQHNKIIYDHNLKLWFIICDKLEKEISNTKFSH